MPAVDRALALSVCWVCLFGCSDANIVDQTMSGQNGNAGQKGTESPLPEDAKQDSWRKPTQHGELAFGIRSDASLQEEAQYHAWTFTLGDSANVTIDTVPFADNLDTVLYLYKRDSPADSWGHYTKRNDDYLKNLWSRLSLELQPAEYRVLVKGFKDSIRGDFGVLVTCEGEGCTATQGPAPSADPLVLPAETAFTTGCVTQLSAVLDSPVTSKTSLVVVYETDRDLLSAAVQRGVDFYASYWQDLGFGWDEFADEETGHHALEVELITLEAGALVTVSFEFGDEVTVSFVLDAALDPLAFFHSEQSPRTGWFCGADETMSGGLLVDGPDEECFGAWIRHWPRAADAVTTAAGTASIDQALATLPALLTPAFNAYQSAAGLTGDAEVHYALERWQSADWGEGALVTVNAEGLDTITYALADTHFGATWLLSQQDSGGTTFICDPQF